MLKNVKCWVRDSTALSTTSLLYHRLPCTMSSTSTCVPSSKENIAKAFFDLDIFDAGPSHSEEASAEPEREVKIETPQATGFFILPTEIRLRIYDLLLVSRSSRQVSPSWSVGETDQKIVLFFVPRMPENRTMEIAILRTCKKIYHEANPILSRKGRSM